MARKRKKRKRKPVEPYEPTQAEIRTKCTEIRKRHEKHPPRSPVYRGVRIPRVVHYEAERDKIALTDESNSDG